MFQTVIDEKDDQLVVTIPPEIRQELNLKRGDLLQIELSKERKPSRRNSRFAPGQLIREHAEILEELGDNREWVNAPAVGRELI